jgi:hypothetical protein
LLSCCAVAGGSKDREAGTVGAASAPACSAVARCAAVAFMGAHFAGSHAWFRDAP